MTVIALVLCAQLLAGLPAAVAAPSVVNSITVGSWPIGVAVNPSSNTIYAANASGNTVSVIDGYSDTVTTTIPVGSVPGGAVFNPTNALVYVANWSGNSVSVIDTATNTVTATVPVGTNPWRAAVNPSTNRVYVTNTGSDNVSVIDGATNTVTSTINVGDYPNGVGVNPATNKIYASNYNVDNVSVIDGATNTVTSTITVGDYPNDVGINPTTNRVYVANQGDENVSVIDGATDSVTTSITVCSDPYQPIGVGVNPASNTVYVTDKRSYYNGHVSVIDGATNTVSQTLELGKTPQCVGIDPDTDLVYISISEDNKVSVLSEPTTITAGAGAGGSISPSGTVSVDFLDDQAFTITPNPGWHVTDVTVDGASQGAVTSYTFHDVIVSHTIHATFAEDAPGGPYRVYLAEGSTDWGYSCYISVQNPNAAAAPVALTYMTSSGPVDGPSFNMPAKSQATVFPSATLGAADFSTLVECTSGAVISADRTMTWNAGEGEEAHCAVGVTAPATTWYLPEGSSDWGFECFLLIQNPNTSTAVCQVTWMIQGEGPQTDQVAVGANSRATFNMADFIGARDASIRVTADKPVIPERAMYRYGRRGGHDSTGTTAAAPDYYLAEGCSGFGFTTYVLVQNPQDTPTDVTITYQSQEGPVDGPTFQMPASSRQTICVNDTTVIPGADPSFSTRVHGSQPIIAERAMYWDNETGQACHDSIGMEAAHASFYLPDGETVNSRETWTLVQNPNAEEVNVNVVYMTPDGSGNVSKTETIPANSRRTFNMAGHSGISGRAAIMVTCTTAGKKIMCERAMYWNDKGAGTDTIGGYSD